MSKSDSRNQEAQTATPTMNTSTPESRTPPSSPPRRNGNMPQRRNRSPPNGGRASPTDNTTPSRRYNRAPKKSRAGSPTMTTFAPSPAVVSPASSRSSSPVEAGDAPMQKRDIYFALDCEMVGVGPRGKESALARVSIVNWDKDVVLDTFVKVPVPVTDYRTHVSGVKPEDIESDKAMRLGDCRAAVQAILKGKILIGHGLKNDLEALGIKHPWFDTRDTAAYHPYMRQGVDRRTKETVWIPRKLRDLVWETTGDIIQYAGGAHSSVEDANAALDLYKAARNEWEMSMVNQLENKVRQSETARQQRLKAQRLVAESVVQRQQQYEMGRPVPTAPPGFVMGLYGPPQGKTLPRVARAPPAGYPGQVPPPHYTAGSATSSRRRGGRRSKATAQQYEIGNLANKQQYEIGSLANHQQYSSPMYGQPHMVNAPQQYGAPHHHNYAVPPHQMAMAAPYGSAVRMQV